MAKEKGMTVKQVLAELEKLADPRARTVWEKMGMQTDTYMGVGLTKLKGVAKTIGKSHELAAELWETGLHDARLLATMIEEPKKITSDQIDRWMADADYWDLSDKISQNVVAKTSFGAEKAREWVESDHEFTRRSAYIIVSVLGKEGKGLTDAELEEFLDRITRTLRGEANWVKEGMNMAMFGIGVRSEALRKKTLAALKKIGPFDVDYGDTSCVLPDAVGYLTKKGAAA